MSRMHQGVEGCIAVLRRRFAILACRRLLRRIKMKCTTCRRFDALPANELSPPLPEDRVSLRKPFEAVGVDHAGPLLIRDGDGNRKAWILLFVCASSRAVYLQLTPSTSSDDFLLVYRRFVARFGKPLLIRSDNGPGFAAAAQLIAIDWKFNPPSAPWHGGFYKRLVAVIKAPLKRVLGQALLKWEEMATLLAEVEFLVNDRPLTCVF